jgi:hypothetical protein
MINEQLKIQARLTNDLRLLLKDYFYFRAAIEFADGKKLTCYGHEHSCTYFQVTSGHVKEIILNAKKGYTDLLKYIESQAKGRGLKSAKIYGRDDIEQPFNTHHRIWRNGDWQEINDPLISPQKNIRILQHEIRKNRIEILGVNEQGQQRE